MAEAVAADAVTPEMTIGGRSSRLSKED